MVVHSLGTIVSKMGEDRKRNAQEDGGGAPFK